MNLLSYIMSTAALVLYCSSYFFNSKKKYLTLQLTGNFFLSLSYFFIGAYFTMVSAAIAIVRGLVCYTYQRIMHHNSYVLYNNKLRYSIGHSISVGHFVYVCVLHVCNNIRYQKHKVDAICGIGTPYKCDFLQPAR